MKLDKKDWSILAELDKNCRQPINQIAKIAGLSKDTTKYRIKRLEEKGIIKGYRTVIDTGKLGFTAYRLLIQFTSMPKEKEEEVKQHLLTTPSLCWLVEVEGNWNPTSGQQYPTSMYLAVYETTPVESVLDIFWNHLQLV